MRVRRARYAYLRRIERLARELVAAGSDDRRRAWGRLERALGRMDAPEGSFAAPALVPSLRRVLERATGRVTGVGPPAIGLEGSVEEWLGGEPTRADVSLNEAAEDPARTGTGAEAVVASPPPASATAAAGAPAGVAAKLAGQGVTPDPATDAGAPAQERGAEAKAAGAEGAVEEGAAEGPAAEGPAAGEGAAEGPAAGEGAAEGPVPESGSVHGTASEAAWADRAALSDARGRHPGPGPG